MDVRATLVLAAIIAAAYYFLHADNLEILRRLESKSAASGQLLFADALFGTHAAASPSLPAARIEEEPTEAPASTLRRRSPKKSAPAVPAPAEDIAAT
jgi:hypothetical protein